MGWIIIWNSTLSSSTFNWYSDTGPSSRSLASYPWWRSITALIVRSPQMSKPWERITERLMSMMLLIWIRPKFNTLSNMSSLQCLFSQAWWWSSILWQFSQEWWFSNREWWFSNREWWCSSREWWHSNLWQLSQEWWFNSLWLSNQGWWLFKNLTWFSQSQTNEQNCVSFYEIINITKFIIIFLVFINQWIFESIRRYLWCSHKPVSID